MPDDFNTNLISDLLTFAKAGKHHEFQYLRNFRDYLFIKKTGQSLLALVNNLVLSSDKLFSEYCQGVSKGHDAIDKLLAYKELDEFITFYEEEYFIVLDVLQEFEAYMRAGHRLTMLFFGERESKDLWDHRGK